MAAAARGAKGSALQVLGVTVLTSYDEADLAAAGYAQGVTETVRRRAIQAQEAGIAGVICAPTDAAMVRAATSPDFQIVTPGVRPLAARPATRSGLPRQPMPWRAGANRIVVGRRSPARRTRPQQPEHPGGTGKSGR